VSISTPVAGSDVIWGTRVNLVASVDDPEQPGLVDDMRFAWVSDRDGPICSQINCDSNGLSFGTHNITFQATDPFGSAAATTVTIGAIAAPITLLLSSPADGATFYTSQSVSLRAQATSPSETIPGGQYHWTSSVAGPLPVVGPNGLAMLTAGTHVISVSVTDSTGQSATQQATVLVVEGAGHPSAVITSPSDNFHVEYGKEITFAGTGTDPAQGTLPDSALEWFSNFDGKLGVGSTLKTILTSGKCGIGTHDITLRVTNGAGTTAEDHIKILAGSVC
jgi:hypothetical protein